MLKISSMNCSAAGESLDENGQPLASMNFNADMYDNYNFNINFHSQEAILSDAVLKDFVEFRQKASILLSISD